MSESERYAMQLRALDGVESLRADPLFQLVMQQCNHSPDEETLVQLLAAAWLHGHATAVALGQGA